MTDLSGLNAALVTPMDGTGAVDEASLARLSRYLVEDHAVPGLVTCVNAGEGWALSLDEQIQVARVTREAVGDAATIIAGVSTRSLEESLQAIDGLQTAGVDALLMLPLPEWSLGPDPDAVRLYFSEVAQRSSVPVGVFQFPNESPAYYDVELLADLVAIPNVSFIKEAQWDDALLGAEVGAMRSANSDLTVLSGVDLRIYESLQPGLDGMLLAAGCILPSQLMELHEAVKAGRDADARAITARMQPLLDLIYGQRPFGRRHAWLKSCLHHLGIIATPVMRAPATTVDPLPAAFIEEMDRLELAASR